jgi:hypothetical protein
MVSNLASHPLSSQSQMNLPFGVDRSEIRSALRDTAIELQGHFLHEDGDLYRVDDLQRALENWLELSIEALVEDALFHVVDGDRATAFNRATFEAQMQRLRPVDVQQSQPVVPLVTAA